MSPQKPFRSPLARLRSNCAISLRRSSPRTRSVTLSTRPWNRFSTPRAAEYAAPSPPSTPLAAPSTLCSTTAPSEAAVATTAGLNAFHTTCVLRGVLAARATVVKKSCASCGSSAFSSPRARSPSTHRAPTSHSSTLLSRPVDATNAASSRFHTRSSTPLLCPANSATAQDVLLRRSHSFSTGVASESSAALSCTSHAYPSAAEDRLAGSMPPATHGSSCCRRARTTRPSGECPRPQHGRSPYWCIQCDSPWGSKRR